MDNHATEQPVPLHKEAATDCQGETGIAGVSLYAVTSQPVIWVGDQFARSFAATWRAAAR